MATVFQISNILIAEDPVFGWCMAEEAHPDVWIPIKDLKPDWLGFFIRRYSPFPAYVPDSLRVAILAVIEKEAAMVRLVESIALVDLPVEAPPTDAASSDTAPFVTVPREEDRRLLISAIMAVMMPTPEGSEAELPYAVFKNSGIGHWQVTCTYKPALCTDGSFEEVLDWTLKKFW